MGPGSQPSAQQLRRSQGLPVPARQGPGPGAIDTGKGLYPTDHFDTGIVTREPERYWFHTREDLREALLELSREEGFISLSTLQDKQGQEVEVIRITYTD